MNDPIKWLGCIRVGSGFYFLKKHPEKFDSKIYSQTDCKYIDSQEWLMTSSNSSDYSYRSDDRENAEREFSLYTRYEVPVAKNDLANLPLNSPEHVILEAKQKLADAISKQKLACRCLMEIVWRERIQKRKDDCCKLESQSKFYIKRGESQIWYYTDTSGRYASRDVIPWTGLQYLCAVGSKKLESYLNDGADPFIMDTFGNNSFDIARMMENKDAMAILESYVVKSGKMDMLAKKSAIGGRKCQVSY